jgi:hypothetical protein
MWPRANTLWRTTKAIANTVSSSSLFFIYTLSLSRASQLVYVTIVFHSNTSVIKKVSPRDCLRSLQGLCQQRYHYTHFHPLQEIVDRSEHKHISGFQGCLSVVFPFAAFHDTW